MRRFWIAGVMVGVLAVGSISGRGDTVYRRDGARFTGVVTHTDEGVSVQTKAGTIVIPESDVDHIEQGSPAPTVLPPPNPSTATPHVTSPTTPATPGHPAAKAVDPKTVQALLDQATSALAVGEYAAARDAFSDVVALDPKNVTALHGLGAAYMYLQEFAKAQGPMERALACSPQPDRALVLNIAVLTIATRNPMRGVKLMRDYLTVHNKVLDEPMLNAMAVALELADKQAQKMPLFADSVQFYLARNAQLEAAVPGQKRWGLEWMPADAVDRIVATNAAAQRKADKASRDLAVAQDRLDKAQADYDQTVRITAKGEENHYYIDNAQREVDYQTSQRDEKASDYDAALAQIKKQNFPTSLALVALTDETPPEVKGMSPAKAAQYADAGPVVDDTNPNPTKPKPKTKKPKTVVTDANNAQPGQPGQSGQPGTPPAPAPITVIQVKPTVAEKVRITSYGVGFPVAPDLLVTAAATVQGATDIQLQTASGHTLKGEVVRTDDASGLALLRVSDNSLHTLVVLPTAFPGGKLECVGFPSPNIFQPTGEHIAGSAAGPKEPWRVRLDQHPRLPGAPLLMGTKVVGVELASRDSDAAAVPAATLDQLHKLLGSDVPAQTPSNVDPADCIVQVLATHESQ